MLDLPGLGRADWKHARLPRRSAPLGRLSYHGDTRTPRRGDAPRARRGRLRLVRHRAGRAVRSLTDAAAEKAITQTTAQYVAWISVLIPLVFAGFLFAVFHRRRRWFGEHLVFATHFATFNFVVALLLIPFQLFFARYSPAAPVALGALALVPMFAWTLLALRRVYGTGWKGAAAGALGLFLAFSVAQSVTALLALGAAVFKIVYFGA